MTSTTAQELENASTDAQTIDDVANGPADLNGDGTTQSRTGGAKKTLSRLQADHEAVIASQTLQEETASASAAIAQAAVQDLASAYYGSVMLPDENGEKPVAGKNGFFYLEGSRSSGARDITPSGNAMWNQTGNSLSIFWDIPLEKYRLLNRAPHLVANHTNAGNRGFKLFYLPLGAVSNPTNHSFTFEINGSSSVASKWVASSDPALPNTIRRVAINVFQDGTNMQVDVLDLDTETWYRGTPVAKPAGFAGMEATTYDLQIGDAYATNDFSGHPLSFDAGGSFNPQNIRSVRGAIADLIIADVVMTDANLLAIYRDGENPADEIGAGNIRLHCPLASNGALDLTVASNIPAVDGESLTQSGEVFAGPSFKKQGLKYFTMDALSYPGFVALEHNAVQAKWVFEASVANLTGIARECQFRIISRDGSGSDWLPCGHSINGNMATISVLLPSWVVSQVQLQFRFDSDPELILATHSDIQIGLHVLAFSQSEGVFAFGRTFDNNGIDTNAEIEGSYIEPAPGIETVNFNPAQGGTKQTGVRPGLIGPQGTLLANWIRKATQQPVMIAMHMISGTSLRDLMDDSVTGRQWDAEKGCHELVLNRLDGLGPDGQPSIPVTGLIKIGWEASDNITAYGREVNYPIYTGNVWPGSTYPFNLDHYFHDGTFSPTMLCVELPCNRATNTSNAGASDQSNEGDQRNSQHNWGHECGYIVGPTSTAHILEGTFSSGGTGDLPTGSRTHPERNRWDGDVEMTATCAEAIRMIAGVGTYPGPVFFESLRPHPTDANKGIATLGPPRLFPGFGTSNPDLERRTDAEPFDPKFSGLRLQTKAAAGNARWAFESKINNAGSFAINNHVGAVVSGREVEIDFGAPVTVGETAILHHPGSTGEYDDAIVTQKTWADSQLYFSGPQQVAGVEIGFQVTGSNIPLVMTL